MKKYCLRLLQLTFGLFLYSLGIHLTVRANVGLAPWDAFSQGISNVTGISFGTVIVLTGALILLLVVLLKEKIGVGTILNTIFIGVFVNLWDYINIVPVSYGFFVGVCMLLLGQVVICFGSYYYIKPGMGCGPRDSLMVALGKRLKKAPIGLVRAGIEAVVLMVGWLMGAKVGFGTIVAVLGIGFILQGVFHIMKFDVKSVEHESLLDTWKMSVSAMKKLTQKGEQR